MVGIVVVSHSQKAAEGAVELAKMMAAEAPVVAAGGLEDGTCGTSFEKIQAKIEEVYSEEGVLIFMDMGSSVMTTEMVLEMYDEKKRSRIHMVDAPMIESTIVAAVSSSCGSSLEEILEEVESTKHDAKW